MAIAIEQEEIALSEGGLYCARGCGRGCTRDEYLDALIKASELQILLGLTSWNVRVWDNLGWHNSAICRNGILRVSLNRGIYFVTAGNQFPHSDEDPFKAIESTLSALRMFIERYKDIQYRALMTMAFK